MTTSPKAARFIILRGVCLVLLAVGVVAMILDLERGRLFFSVLLPSAWIASVLLWPRPEGIEFSLFGWLWIVTLVLPAAVFWFDRPTAIVTGIATPVIWWISMPLGCMGGAFAAFPMAAIQLGSLAFWIDRLRAMITDSNP